MTISQEEYDEVIWQRDNAFANLLTLRLALKALVLEADDQRRRTYGSPKMSGHTPSEQKILDQVTKAYKVLEDIPAATRERLKDER